VAECSVEGVKGLNLVILDFSFKVTGNWGVPHPQTEGERGDASVITRAAVLCCAVLRCVDGESSRCCG
jgi:hypothetical protein